MNCIWLILIWILICDSHSERGNCSKASRQQCAIKGCNERERPCNESDRCDERPRVAPNRCDENEDLPFLPGGRPFGAFDGNHTCGCEEKPV